MGLLLTFCFVMQTTDAMGMPPKKKNRGAAKAAHKVDSKPKANDIEKERQAEAARKAKAEAERLEKERQAADLKRQEAADKGQVKGEQTHVHFSNRSALNEDGTWKEGIGELTRAQEKWLVKNGWRLPSE